LFVEGNRSETNPRIWSKFTADLPKQERERILDRWWRPHRTEVEKAVASAARKSRAVHVAVHSFTPELDGEVRNADVSFLYDSRRMAEAALCRRWAAILNELDPELRIRHNYPYRGASDGLSTWLRKQHTESGYLGVEIEINQALVDARGWRTFQQNVASSLAELMATDSEPRRVSARRRRAIKGRQ
jgi:predicted N-formylglutamate amidohydrolase